MNLNLNLLVIIISLLTWTTPSFCPLTFVQANTLKALPSTPANLTKIITVVESASDKDIAGIKVLAKRFGLDVASASKAALLAKLRADLAELSGGAVVAVVDLDLGLDMVPVVVAAQVNQRVILTL